MGAKLGSKMPDVSVVDVPGVPANQGGGGLEAHLDVEVIGSICPDATITIYRAANDDRDQGFADAVFTATEDGNHVISISWGHPERVDDSSSMLEFALLKARVAGVTVCVASGDWGSSGGPNSMDGKAHGLYPAASAFAVACGGTQLEGYGIKAVLDEGVWND